VGGIWPWQTRDGFGLFRPWQDPQAGDEPLAVFTDLADARLAVVARSLIRRTRYYQLREPQYPHPVAGYAILREGEEKGRLRLFEPEWIDVMNVLTCTAQTAEGLAVVLDLGGPATQEELGGAISRTSGERPVPAGEIAQTSRERPVPAGEIARTR
jgi:hypothetical protein